MLKHTAHSEPCGHRSRILYNAHVSQSSSGEKRGQTRVEEAMMTSDRLLLKLALTGNPLALGPQRKPYLYRHKAVQYHQITIKPSPLRIWDYNLCWTATREWRVCSKQHGSIWSRTLSFVWTSHFLRMALVSSILSFLLLNHANTHHPLFPQISSMGLMF